MRELLLEELEIVAFDGTLRGFCAPVLPVVRWKKQDLYAKISTEEQLSAPKAWYSTEEFEALCNQGLVTRLPEPVGQMFENAMLVYLSGELLSNAGVAENECAARNRWVFPGTERTSYYVLSASADQIVEFLDSIARKLHRKVDQSLIRQFAQREDRILATVQNLLTMAFSAAQSPAVRSRLYLQEGVRRIQTSDSDTLHTVHKLLVEKEFPNWSWKDYSEDVFAYAHNLRRLSESHRIPCSAPPIERGQYPNRLPRPKTVAIQAITSDSPARKSEPAWLVENIKELDITRAEAEPYEAIVALMESEEDDG